MKRLIVVAVLAAGCSRGGGAAAPNPTTRPTDPPAATLPADALSQMEIAFVGGPRKSVIKGKLDKALKLYGLKPNENNYRRAGDALVAVRRSAEERGCNDCTEMAILEQMLADGALPGLSFQEAVGWTVALLDVE